MRRLLPYILLAMLAASGLCVGGRADYRLPRRRLRLGRRRRRSSTTRPRRGAGDDPAAPELGGVAPRAAGGRRRSRRPWLRLAERPTRPSPPRRPAGLQVLLSLDGIPEWAEQGKRPRRVSGRHLQALAGGRQGLRRRRSAGTTRARFGTCSSSTSRTSTPTWRRSGPRGKMFAPVRYRALLNAAYPGIHAAGMKLVTAGTAPYGDAGKGGSRIRPRLVLARRHAQEGALRRPRPPPVRDRRPAPARLLEERHRRAGRPPARQPDPRRGAPRDGSCRGRARATGSPRSAGTRSRRIPTAIPCAPSAAGSATRCSSCGSSASITSSGSWSATQRPTPSYAATRQSGMYFASGKAKPALRAFRFPFSCERRGSGTRVWVRTPDTARRAHRDQRAGSCCAPFPREETGSR